MRRCVTYGREVLRRDGSGALSGRTAGTVPLLVITSGLLALMAVLLVLWMLARPADAPGCPGSADDCAVAPELELPQAIRFGSQAPVVTVALFVDLGSAASRQVFQQMTRAVSSASMGQPTQLQLLHAPAVACEDPKVGWSCEAARAVECVEQQMPGVGIRAAGAAFDLQWRTQADLVADMGRLGVDVVALRRCLHGDAAVDARLAAHAEAAHRYGLSMAPGGFVIVADGPPRVAPFGPWLTEASLRVLLSCIEHEHCQGEP